jgi:hypothetical protein
MASTTLEFLRGTIGWMLGRESFVAQVLACGGDADGCDARVAELVQAGQSIAGARRIVVERLMLGPSRAN